jgi:hypothetical protein
VFDSAFCRFACLYPFFEGFTRLKRGYAFLVDGDFLARARVPSDTSVAFFDLEHAEITNFEAMSFGEAFRNGIQSLLDDIRDFILGVAEPFRNLDHQLPFGHVVLLSLPYFLEPPAIQDSEPGSEA